MLTVMIILACVAFGTSVACGMGKCPAWVPLMILSLYALLQVLPKD